jgi:outer membrane protein assembly factor BamB
MRSGAWFFAASLFTQGVAAPALGANWPTFGGSSERLNYNGKETVLTARAVPALKVHWSLKLTGGSAAQPLYIEKVATKSGTHDELYVATVTGYVTALNAATGNRDWFVGLPRSQAMAGSCVTPGHGVNGTPTIDPVAGVMYVVDGVGGLHSLNIATGAETAGYPIQVIAQQDYFNGGYNHSSPTLNGAMLYITTSDSGNCENLLAPFHGAVIAVNTRMKAVVANYFPVSLATGGGGIWGPGGALRDAVSGNLFVATGNALAPPTDGPDAESVVELSPTLKRLEGHTPVKYGNVVLLTDTGDLDFGSTPTEIDSPGCAPLLSVINKDGYLFLYNRHGLGAGPLQILQMAPGAYGDLFRGMGAYDPAANMLFINNPVTSDGVAATGGTAFKVASPTCRLTTAWQTTIAMAQFENTPATDPLVAAGVVWFTTGNNGSSVLAMDEQTGAPLWSSGTLPAAPMTTVLVNDGQMFVQAGNILTAYGL